MESKGALIPVTESQAAPRVPLHLRYFLLLRNNPNFRRLWAAQLVSEIGDWFYSLAVYDLLLETTHSGKAVSWAITIQFLPMAFMTPVAGALVDRFARRRLMIIADIVRGFTVLGLLLVHKASDIWMVYLVLGIETIFSSIFEPARNALLPNLARSDELLPANALSSATWSFCLASGAPLGGLVTALWGRQAAFVLNSISFFASAFFLLRIVSIEKHMQAIGHAAGHAIQRQLNMLREGVAYLRHNPRVMALVLSKAGLGLNGGALLLLAVFGERVFPVVGHGALGMGLLYGARGVGAGMGPLVGDRLTHGIESRMWKSIGFSFFLMGTAYVAFSFAPVLPVAAVCVFFAHMGGSNIWVMSTTLLQLHSIDRFRGRIFALDMGLNTLSASLSNWFIGFGLDNWGFTPRQLARRFGAMLTTPGFAWLPVQAKWGKHVEQRIDQHATSIAP